MIAHETERRILEFSRRATENDELLAFLRDESERCLSADPESSLGLAEALICAAELARRPDHRARGLRARGAALGRLGRDETFQKHCN